MLPRRPYRVADTRSRTTSEGESTRAASVESHDSVWPFRPRVLNTGDVVAVWYLVEIRIPGSSGHVDSQYPAWSGSLTHDARCAQHLTRHAQTLKMDGAPPLLPKRLEQDSTMMEERGPALLALSVVHLSVVPARSGRPHWLRGLWSDLHLANHHE